MCNMETTWLSYEIVVKLDLQWNVRFGRLLINWIIVGFCTCKAFSNILSFHVQKEITFYISYFYPTYTDDAHVENCKMFWTKNYINYTMYILLKHFQFLKLYLTFEIAKVFFATVNNICTKYNMIKSREEQCF